MHPQRIEKRSESGENDGVRVFFNTKHGATRRIFPKSSFFGLFFSSGLPGRRTCPGFGMHPQRVEKRSESDDYDGLRVFSTIEDFFFRS